MIRNFFVAGLLAAAPAPRAQGARSGSIKVTTKKEVIEVKKKHPVVAANTLWDLAAFYYEDPWQWPRIYEANKDRIRDPHWIYPGQTFIIPGLDRMITIVDKLTEGTGAEDEGPLADERPINYRPDEYAGATPLPDSLSVELPPSLAGQAPAMYRMKMAERWKADGRVVEYQGRESMTAAGDYVAVRLDKAGKVKKGQRYVIFRRSAPAEADVDKDASYMQKVGLLEIVRRLSKSGYRARILRSGGSVMVDDVLKAEN